MILFLFIDEGWEPFTSGSYYSVWKKPNVDYPNQNLYIYKGKQKIALGNKILYIIMSICLVHGSFDDVTALDYMQVQLDIDYRKEWDGMSVDLEIFDSEPLTHSDLIYWELRWPVIIII